jgi:hypothetical protein
METKQEQLVADLRGLKTIIGNGWCQFSAAHDEDGYEIDPTSPRAVCFCLLGGMTHHLERFGIISDQQAMERRQAMQNEILKHPAVAPFAANEPGVVAISNYNDAPHRTKTSVEMMLLETIERVKLQHA